MSEMHAGTLASVIWMLNGYEEDDDEEPEKPPAVVLAFAPKETEDDE